MQKYATRVMLGLCLPVLHFLWRLGFEQEQTLTVTVRVTVVRVTVTVVMTAWLLGLQLKASREVSPSTEIRINGEGGNSTAQQASSAGGAASYGASTMGITIQPAPASAHSDDDSMGDSSPSRSGSPARVAAATSMASSQEQQTQQSPAEAFATLSKQQAVMTPHRVSMLRGGPVAGAYSDGRYGGFAVCLTFLLREGVRVSLQGILSVSLFLYKSSPIFLFELSSISLLRIVTGVKPV